MMTRLVRLADKNIFLNIMIRAFVYISAGVINLYYGLSGWLRGCGICSSQYKDILEFKGKYQGERCFIICTGPSLTASDLELINDEYTFAMNSLCLLDENINFKPKFFGCVDLVVFRKLEKEMKNYCKEGIETFVPDRIKRHCEINKAWHVFPFNVAYHTYSRWFRGEFWCKYSNDCYKIVYDMFSVTHALIQLAVYMGFKEIYLIGADCSYLKGGKNHFIEHGIVDTQLNEAAERNLAGYLKLKEWMDKSDFKIYNATRGGALEVFPRIELEKVLGKE